MSGARHRRKGDRIGREIDLCDIFRNQLRDTHREQQAVPLTAELIASHQCEALGIVAMGHAPALALCRELLSAGAHPDTALAVYRNGVLALRIRSIREGARLAVEDGETGTPRLRLARPARRGAASPMRKNGGRAS
jgi:hypothetical protein